MELLIIFIYIAIIPIILSLCKAAGMDEAFKSGEEYFEKSNEKSI